MSNNEAAERLQEGLDYLRHGYQPTYNGRPSCPLCGNFVDDEETHKPECLTLSDAVAEALAAERRATVRRIRSQINWSTHSIVTIHAILDDEEMVS